MKYILVLVAFLVTFQISHAQMAQFEDGPYKSYYKTGEVKTQGQIVNGKFEGKWMDYHINGQVSKEYEYNDGKLESDYISYYENGIIKQEAKTEDGRDVIIGYYESGNAKYKMQSKNGYYKEYSEQGDLKIEANYKDYQLYGVWTSFYTNGNKEWQVNYLDGYRNGVYKLFYESGELKLEGHMIKDQKKGEEKRYTEDGLLEWKGYYDNDKFDKTWTQYDSTHKKTNKITFKNGVTTDTDQSIIIKPTAIPDGVIDKVPVYPGCQYVYGNNARKECMSRAITRLVNLNFNTNIALNRGLSGRYRIAVIFKIGKDGKVFQVRARAAHPDLEEEAIRIVKSLPKIQPGYQYGEPVEVPYSLPILFQVQ